MGDILLTRREKDIATVILNRPQKLNALSRELWLRVGKAMRELSSDETLRCIVLRGAGEKAFSPGADISEFAAHRSNRRQARDYGALIQKAMQSIRDCQHPVIAMIQGVCVGGGLELASMCDLRICGESSRFGVPVNRIAITMAYPEIRALIDLVGRATALEILLEGRVFGALEAKVKGLVTRVVPDSEVEEQAYAAARRIADGAPLANRLHKRFAYRLLDPKPLTEAEVDQGFEIVGTEDHREGYRAFLTKTKPRFKAR